MQVIQAECGEMVYEFIERVLEEANKSSWNGFIARHNDIDIRVYKGSCMNDLCDKHDMQRLINRLKGE